MKLTILLPRVDARHAGVVDRKRPPDPEHDGAAVVPGKHLICCTRMVLVVDGDGGTSGGTFTGEVKGKLQMRDAAELRRFVGEQLTAAALMVELEGPLPASMRALEARRHLDENDFD